MRFLLFGLAGFALAGAAGVAWMGNTEESPGGLGKPARAERRVVHTKAHGQLGPGRGTLLVGLEPPEGGKLTAGAPFSVEATGEHLKFPKKVRASLDPAKLPVRLPVDVVDGATGPARVKLSFYWCKTGDEAACTPERVELVVALDLTGDAAGGEAFVSYRVGG